MYRGLMKIALGTTSKHKVNASKAALTRAGVQAEVVAVKTGSGVPEQPFGIEQTRTGAVNRAMSALDQVHDADAGLGVESGLVPVGDSFIALAIVAFVQRGQAPRYATSTGIEFPQQDVLKSLVSKQNTTAGDFIAMRTGCDGTDPHEYLTGGRLRRNETLEQAIFAELVGLPPSRT